VSRTTTDNHAWVSDVDFAAEVASVRIGSDTCTRANPFIGSAMVSDTSVTARDGSARTAHYDRRSS